MQDVKGLFKSF